MFHHSDSYIFNRNIQLVKYILLLAALYEFGTVTSSIIKVDNLVNLVSRMSLHEDERRISMG